MIAVRRDRARIAGRLGLIVVRVGMDDEPAAHDARRSRRQRDALDRGIELAASALIRLQRRQIARVVIARGRVSMRLGQRIEVSLRAHAVARAAVADFVDVEAVLLVRLQALRVDEQVHLVVANLLEGRFAECVASFRRLKSRSGNERFLRLLRRALTRDYACGGCGDGERIFHFTPPR
jgi:hypothetical protein